jgi:hypothetical protein
MVKSWIRDFTLAIQARVGASIIFFVCAAIASIAAVTAYAFLCVAGYDWFAVECGRVFAALIMTAIFLVVGIIAAASGTRARQRTRERAILERAARERAVLEEARTKPRLFDPKLLTIVVQAARSFGWERLVPLALFGFIAAQWLRDYREQRPSMK